jgi:hypothetical protein
MSTKPGDGAHRDKATSTPAPAVDNTGSDQPPVQRPPRTQSAPDQHTEVIGTHSDRSGPDHHSEPSRGDVLARQKNRFGGIKWGSAFFGWLTAIGTAVLLSALLAAIGLSITSGTQQTADQARQNPDMTQTAGIVSAIVAAVVLLIAYYCGGYVAGRMARFNGMKQGVAVWVWTIIITIVVAILAAIAGAKFDVLSNIEGLPQLPVSSGDVALATVISAAVALVVALVGAILGGLAGMRFHRKIDRADLDTH